MKLTRNSNIRQEIPAILHHGPLLFLLRFLASVDFSRDRQSKSLGLISDVVASQDLGDLVRWSHFGREFHEKTGFSSVGELNPLELWLSTSVLSSSYIRESSDDSIVDFQFAVVRLRPNLRHSRR